MTCEENCACILCLQLKGCERKLKTLSNDSANFILTKPSEKFPKLNEKIPDDDEPKKLMFFGMDADFEKFSTLDKTERPEPENTPENRHKSVIYVNDDGKEDAGGKSTIEVSEQIDEHMSFHSIENSNVITVIFKNTFGFASQIINEVHMCGYEYYSDESDDFPLGMEADMFRQYMEKRR